jgi:hypothetical protein
MIFAKWHKHVVRPAYSISCCTTNIRQQINCDGYMPHPDRVSGQVLCWFLHDSKGNITGQCYRPEILKLQAKEEIK